VAVRVVCLLAWVALVRPARAEPRTDAGLIWQAPATCPDAADVRARIERRLGMPLERVHGIEVEITPDGSAFIARIDLRGITVENTIRTLSSVRCDALTDAVAVIVARLAMEAYAAPQTVELEMPPTVVRRAVVPPAAPSTFGGGVRVLGLSGVGALPGVSVGPEVGGYLRYQSAFVEVAGERWKPETQELSHGAPGRVDVGLGTLDIRAGWNPPDLPLRGWAVFELGIIQGEGVSLDDPSIGTGGWTAVGGGFGVAWPMSAHSRIVGTVEAVAPIARARFVLQDGSEVFRPGPATARCAFGLEVGWR
jgi:hypothetical protein